MLYTMIEVTNIIILLTIKLYTTVKDLLMYNYLSCILLAHYRCVTSSLTVYIIYVCNMHYIYYIPVLYVRVRTALSKLVLLYI